MINIRNVTIKPSGRREGRGGGKTRRKETKGNEEQTKKNEMEKRNGSTEKKTIHLGAQMKNARGVKASDGSID